MPGSRLTWTNTTVRLGDLKPWADNPKYSTKAQAERIIKSFDKFGQVQTIAIGPECEVYDGHQRLSALLTLHGADYVVDARQSSRPLTQEERKELVVTLHTAAVGSYDWDALSGWNVQELKGWGMDEDVLKGWNNAALNLRMMMVAEISEGDAFDALPNSDRPPFQQMTFTLHDTQAEIVREALKLSKGMGDFKESENENGNGNALSRICEVFITQNGNG